MVAGGSGADDEPIDHEILSDEFELQVRMNRRTFLSIPAGPLRTVADVKAAIEARLGPRASEQRLMLVLEDGTDPLELLDAETLRALQLINLTCAQSLCR